MTNALIIANMALTLTTWLALRGHVGRKVRHSIGYLSKLISASARYQRQEAAKVSDSDG